MSDGAGEAEERTVIFKFLPQFVTFGGLDLEWLVNALGAKLFIRTALEL